MYLYAHTVSMSLWRGSDLGSSEWDILKNSKTIVVSVDTIYHGMFFLVLKTLRVVFVWILK